VHPGCAHRRHHRRAGSTATTEFPKPGRGGGRCLEPPASGTSGSLARIGKSGDASADGPPRCVRVSANAHSVISRADEAACVAALVSERLLSAEPSVATRKVNMSLRRADAWPSRLEAESSRAGPRAGSRVPKGRPAAELQRRRGLAAPGRVDRYPEDPRPARRRPFGYGEATTSSESTSTRRRGAWRPAWPSREHRR